MNDANENLEQKVEEKMRKYIDKIDSITGKVEELGCREGSVMKEVTGLKEVLEQKTMVNERVGGEKMKVKGTV